MSEMFHITRYAKMKKRALYRHFDAFGRLLYVGVSLCAFTRTRQHGQSKPWFEDVARIDIEWFATRHEALTAEWQAIKNERPVYNQAFNKRAVSDADRPIMVIGDTFISRAAFKQIAVRS